MKCHHRLSVLLILQALLIIIEAGRNTKPHNSKFPLPGSSHGTRTSPGRSHSGRVSPTQINGGNQFSGVPHPNRSPVQPSPFGAPSRFNSQPPATLPLNTPQASGPLDWSKLRFPGTGPQVRPHHSGTGLQVRPQNSGAGSQVRYPAPAIGPQIRPQNSGAGSQVRYPAPAVGPQIRPQNSGAGPQVRFPAPAVGPQIRPQNSGAGPQDRFQAPAIGPQTRPQNSGAGPWFRFQNPGTAFPARPARSGESASYAPQTPIHSPADASSVNYSPSLSNMNFPSLAPKPTDFGAKIDRSSVASSSSLGYHSGSRSSISSIDSARAEPIGLDAPKSTAIMKSVAHPKRCVDNTKTTPKIIAPANHCFDYFKFAIGWNPGMAYKLRVTGYEIRTDRVRPSWVIHGLWPTMFGRSQDPMPGCQRYDVTFSTYRFVDHKILGALDNIWYTLLAKQWSDNKKFWEHEFYKHGSCASRSSVIKDDVNYFKRSLELNAQLDIGMTLARNGINVGVITKLGNIVDAIENKVGAKVKIEYVNNPHTGENYLAGLHVCYDTLLRVMDCPNVYLSKEQLETDIRYLEQLPRV